MRISYFILSLYSALLRIITPNSGITKLTFNPFTNWLFSNVTAKSSSMLRTRTSDGVPIEVDITDHDGRILWMCGSNDFKVSRVANALLSQNMDFLDIGANYGTIGFSAACRMKPGDTVHLFEPQPRLSGQLRKAIEASGLDAVIKLHEVALYDRDVKIPFSVPLQHSGKGSLVNSAPANESLTVEARSTASYVEPLIGDRPFGVKIDVEGAEAVILPDLIALKDQMRFCIFEGSSNQVALYEMFNSRGFLVFGLCRTVLKVNLSFISSQEELHSFHDFLAIRLSTRPTQKRMTLDNLVKCVRSPS
ncbi:FkbM family methyltransferase [Rhodovulum sulfidophilum]|uniref:FkbM family methyltransferase n=2 Tax=Rhodovulum sulfidophilum TaxID=35806 RepID=UPI00117B74B7|nr:FkbM family methyltransferase [Rhodovulum sulfidophilum]MBL3551665.1 FkbM family methyltransferase [Rhodovulum sulfidophilum]